MIITPASSAQPNGIAQIEKRVQIEQNRISLSVSIQAEPVRTVCTSAQYYGR